MTPVIPTDERACKHCGCTDDRACLGGCVWVSADECSACRPDRVEACRAVVRKLRTKRSRK